MRFEGRSFARRAFLQGAGLGAFALPFLRTIEGRAAGGKRLLIFHSNNGTVMREFFPASPGVFGRILKPLEPFKTKLSVYRGINMESAYKTPIPKDHLPDNANALTARQATTDAKPTGISIDQHIANTIGKQTKFASLQLGVRVGNYAQYVSARGPGQGIFPEISPYKAFTRIFGDVTADPRELERIRRERKSIIDALRLEVTDLRCALGAEEQPKLDAHLESIRELERGLDIKPAPGCTPPQQGAPIALDTSTIPEQVKLQIDVAAAALACDLTRVLTLQLGNGSSGLRNYRWIGIDYTHHGISHGSEGVTAPSTQREEWLNQIETWNAEQFLHLLQKLDAVQEGNGTVLDQSAVLWTHEQSNGGSHLRKDMPYVLAGGCGGAFKMGQAVNFGGKPHNGLLISLANAMGVPTVTFGDPDFSKGPLVGL
jgi:hypothetical protein